MLILDQATKHFALSHLPASSAASARRALLRVGLNPRGAGGRAARGGRALVVLLALEAAALMLLVSATPFFATLTARVALGAALGGAASNLADRLARGGVVDFIDLRFWPAWNLADAAIVAGALVAAASGLRG